MSKSKSQVKRAPKRAIYDTEKIYEIRDREFLCHVALVHNGHPISIPTMYGRSGDSLYLHGASVSRLLTELEKEIDVCILQLYL